MNRTEAINGGFHMAAVVIISPMLGYNAKEWALRKERRNGINALIYAAALGFEVYNTFGHWACGTREVD